MNKHVHSLVFDRRRGMRVPAAEHVRRCGKAAGGESRASSSSSVAAAVVGLLGSIAAGLGGDPACAQSRSIASSMQRASSQAAVRAIQNLPVRSTDAARLKLDSGSFKVSDDTTTGGTTMTVDQYDKKVIINWDSFDLGKGYTVRFVQPTNGAALNNIWSNDPSVILGNIQANGEVILQNQNGIIFGPTARVETGRFVATALSLANETFEKGIRAVTTGKAVFGSDTQGNQGFITIERGAEIKSLSGGDVIMVAPKVYNEGRIETPSGQAILAAGQKVYLYANTSNSVQRGLMVAVDAFSDTAAAPEGINTVEQAEAASYKTVNGQTVDDSTPDNTAGLVNKINQVIANEGTINLVGLAVRQNGVLTASTAVKGANGGIYLQAMKDTYQVDDTKGPRLAKTLGSVELGGNSVTSVTPVDSSATQTSSEAFYRSRVNIDGADVRLHSGAFVQAVSGNVQIRAAKDARNSALFGGSDAGKDNSTLVVESGVTLSAAGLRDVALPMSRNQLSTQLFQIDLANTPVQRDGVLYRQSILSDARQQVTVADVRGFYNLIGRTARELSIRGGNVVLASLGKTVVADGAKIDISGGSVRYLEGKIASSYLATKQGTVVSIEEADPDVRYAALITPDLKESSALNTASYVEGADAGYLSVLGSTLYFGGSIDASVVLGPLQRTGGAIGDYGYVYGTTKAAYSLLSDELGWAQVLKDQPWLYASLTPSAGTVTFGSLTGVKLDPLLSHIELVRQRSTSVVPASGSEAAADFYAALEGKTELSSAALQDSGLAHLAVTAATVSMSSDAALNLGASGSFSVDAASSVNLAGQVVAEGGTVSVTTRDQGSLIKLEDTAVLDVSGRQDDERSASRADAVAVSGGSISLGAAGSVDVRGATLDVSGGYWVSGASKVKGSAGSITLEANRGLSRGTDDRSGRLLIDGVHWTGHDFSQGGTLTLSGMRTLLVGEASASDAGVWSSGLTLSTDFFSSGGFGTFNLSALGDVQVAENAQLVARKQNLALSQSGKRTLAGQSAPVQLTTTTLEDGLRSGVTLNLTASSSPDRSATAGSNEFAEGGSVRVAKGALIDVGAGGAVGLKAGRDIEVAGAIVAHGGAVSMQLTGARDGGSESQPQNVVGYIEDQAIRLTATSRVDVSGIAKLVSTGQGTRTRQTGSVLSGGTVTLGDLRGQVITEAGSVIDVSGASADLQLDASTRKTTISAGAGTVNVSSADGFELQGTLKAYRPDATVSGGAFNATLSLNGGTDYVVASGSALGYPAAARNILLTGSKQQLQEAVETAAGYGQGLLSTQALLDAGFDRIGLHADDSITLGRGANLVSAPASGNKQVALRAVTLDTRALVAGDSAAHTVQANYVALGNKTLVQASSTDSEMAKATATSGDATLAVNAGLIEVYGYAGLRGFGTTHLQATLAADQGGLTRTNGELRFIGRTLSATSSNISGGFYFDGELTLQAGSIYTTTLSSFSVQGNEGASTLRVKAPDGGSTSSMPLSALGTLKLAAWNIELDGPLYQPFGRIDVDADNTLTLGAHAALSVSGDGLLVPVGSTINGATWNYATAGTQAGVAEVGDAVQGLDALSLVKGIALTSDTLTLSKEARLDASAGGDLQAWEFVSGVGGRTDVLNQAGYYAVLPGYHYDFAPYDTEIMATSEAVGTSLRAGDQVTVSTSNGVLAAGTYTLLPARYALLPGAVLVSAAALSKGGGLSEAQTADDGSVTVAGYVTSTGTALGSSKVGAALVLAPQSTVLGRSAFTLTSLNDYKAAQAASDGLSVFDSPSSAGRMALNAQHAFDVKATFDLAGGGELDLTMGSRMAVVAAGQDAPDDYATVSLEALNATGASSILLGGLREGTVGDATITASSDEVLWASSINTEAELISVATDRVTVVDGVTLSNSAKAEEGTHRITLKGQSAALVLSNHVNASLERDLSGVAADAALAGSLVLGEGVTLAGAAVQLDASASLQLPASVSFQARSVSLGARNVSLGGGSEDASTLSLSAGQLDALKGLEYLTLRATHAIDMVGSASLGELDASGQAVLKNLVLDASVLRGVGSSDDLVTLRAANVDLRHTSSESVSAEAGASSLLIDARPVLNDVQTGGITVGPGAQQLAFQHTTLHSTGDVIFTGQGSLGAKGDLTISAARITATTQADQSVAAEGTLRVSAVDALAHTLGEQRGSGAKLSLSGQTLVQGGRIELPTGKLTLQARGDVTLESGSITSTAGVSQAAGKTWAVTQAGGDIAVTADAGNVTVRGTLDVSASRSDSATSKRAGQITLVAKQGDLVLGEKAALLGAADTDALSGQLKVDTGAVRSESAVTSAGTLDRLAALADAGQMRGSVNWRLRRGAQSLDTTLRANRVTLSVDDGSLTLMGHATVDARAPAGGVVSLSARDDLILQTNASAATEGAGAQTGARILADSSREGANGGDVLLNATQGTVNVQAGVSLSAVGDADDSLDGRIVLRAGTDTSALAAETVDYAKVVKVTIADASGLKAGQVSVEAVQVYDSQDAGIIAEDGVYVYARTVQRHGAVTATTVEASATSSSKVVTTIAEGAGTQTVLQRYVKDGDGLDIVIDETVTSVAFDSGTTPTTSSKTSNRTASTQFGTSYIVANAQETGRTEAGLALNATNTSHAAAERIAADAALVMDHAADIRAALGLDKANAATSDVRWGVELRTHEDLTISNNWNLADLRPGGTPVALTVRSTHNLNVVGNLSDGFATATRAASGASSPTAILGGEAASYRLVAGADLSAANLLATNVSVSQGDLVIGSGTVVRTTAGSIELAAGRDVVLSAGTGSTPAQGVVYVAGRLDELAADEVQTSDESVWAQYTSHGGRLDVTAERDITAPGFTQLFGNWLYHTGTTADAVSWYTVPDTFKQGLGSFGGGSLLVSAGEDVINVGVVAPTSSRMVAKTTSTTVVDADGNVTTETSVGSASQRLANGGDVTVEAGGDILGGVYLLSRGAGLVDAGGALLAGTAHDATKLAAQNAIFGLMGGQWSVQARGDLNLGWVYNPTIVPTASRVSSAGNFFYSYDEDSAFNVSSAAGNLTWVLPGAQTLAGSTATQNWHSIYSDSSDRVAGSNNTSNSTATPFYFVLPPVLNLEAGGDVSLSLSSSGSGSILYPSAQGDLNVYAGGDLVLKKGSLTMADTNPATWANERNPMRSLVAITTPRELQLGLNTELVQTGSTLHQDDDKVVRLFAGGDLAVESLTSAIKLSKAADIEAGGDIRNLVVSVQHFDDQDVSVIESGGNIEGINKSDVKDTYAIKVEGPGELRVTAGQDLNLNESNGIIATGNINNDALPDQSATLRVAAGGSKRVSLASFRSLYLGDATTQAALIEHVRSVLNLPDDAPLTVEQAWSLYAGMTNAHQRVFADRIVDQAFAQRFAGAWVKAAAAAGVAPADLASTAFLRFKDQMVIAEMKRIGGEAVSIADSTDAIVNAQRQAQRQALWDELNHVLSLAGMGAGYTTQGDINVAASKIHTLAPGDRTVGGINLFTPGGDVVVGLTANNSKGQGIVTAFGGSINAIVDDAYQVNSQKTFVVGEGDLSIYSVRGAIDSGRGSNSAVSAPASYLRLIDGYPVRVAGSTTTGSGLAVLPTADGKADGDINLFAPVGGVIALDTYIRTAGNIATAGPVKGGDNVKGGTTTSTSVTAATGPSLSVGTTVKTDTAAGAEESVSGDRSTRRALNGILTVDLLAVGDDACAAQDQGGLKDRDCEKSVR